MDRSAPCLPACKCVFPSHCLWYSGYVAFIYRVCLTTQIPPPVASRPRAGSVHPDSSACARTPYSTSRCPSSTTTHQQHSHCPLGWHQPHSSPAGPPQPVPVQRSPSPPCFLDANLPHYCYPILNSPLVNTSRVIPADSAKDCPALALPHTPSCLGH